MPAFQLLGLVSGQELEAVHDAPAGDVEGDESIEPALADE
jgi:hypothetical protein